MAACLALASPAAASEEGCLAYGDPTTLLTGMIYAVEAFDEAEGDTVQREREIDYYALILSERVCAAGVPGDPNKPELRNLTVVRLDIPVEVAKAALQRKVMVQGPLAAEPGADAPLVMKVAGMTGAR
ncbi:hypothetical protein [Phenylobacterium sp.]|uniref:hypothetical protein n=1 Tax=Phenylobacterium sp. TaxID=1871053 RepID=UPI0028122CD2|nr:hypothetical protein [Phenylobacterium sp.]